MSPHYDPPLDDSEAIKTCPVCGGTDGRCQYTKGLLADEPSLTLEDWRDMYNFIVTVELPFIHGLIARARARRYFERQSDPGEHVRKKRTPTPPA